MNGTAAGLPAELVIPPLPPKLGRTMLLAGVAICALVGLAGLIADGVAVSTQPAEMQERLKWTAPQPGVPGAEKGSPGERARLLAEIGRTMPLSTLRLAAVAIGLAGVVGGVYLLGGGWRAWLVAAGAGVFVGFGFPLHWDSMRLVVWVGAALAAAAAGLSAMPAKWRYSLLAGAAVVHFLGLLVSSSLPETQGRPGPWVSGQLSGWVYFDYKHFAYQTNAYHFYSPNPGPASKYAILLDYDIADPDAPGGTKQTAEWVELPRRRTDYRDPLGLTYYRRLSVTELPSFGTVGTQLPASWEKGLVMESRKANELGQAGRLPVPGASTSFVEMDLSQYNLPSADSRRLVFPSYVRHIAAEYGGPRTTPDGRVLLHTVTKVRLFRLEHRILDPYQILDRVLPEEAKRAAQDPKYQPKVEPGSDPFHPSSYSPYYLGEYAADGTLLNPNDPLLYWHLPVGSPPPNPDRPNAPKWDYLSEYAGRKYPWGGKE